MKNCNSLVSIIIPVYKVEEYLIRCVSSVREQTYRNLEIILVDDGSPDNCPAICDKLAEEDERIVVIHKKNQGLGMARNSGIDIARGEWLCFVDSDDFIDKKYVELLLSAAVENDCLTAQCKYRKGIKGSLDDSKEVEHRIQVFDMDEYIYYCYSKAGHSIFATWINIYHRSLFETIRFPDLKHTEDIPAVSQLMKKASSKRFAVVDQYMYYWFQRSGSIMNRKTTLDILDQCEAYERVLNFWINEKRPDIADIYWPAYFEVLIDEYTKLSRDLPDFHKDYEFLLDKISNNFEKANWICHELVMIPPKPSLITQTLLSKQPFILYGYGEHGRYALPWLEYFHIPIIEIWDKDAQENVTVNNIPMKPAHNNLNKDITILITVEDFFAKSIIMKNLREMGYNNFIEWVTLENALKYVIYSKFLPFLIKNEE